MGKGNPREVEKGVLGGQNSGTPSSSSLNVPPAPVYYPTEEEFKNPLEFINKIKAEAEPYGICRIVPPSSWKPPFALDLDKFTFPTKTQAIHQLQVRPPSCDPKTFHLEYKRFLEDVAGKKLRGRVVFEGDDLDLCKLFNGVKRYGGYDKVVEEKKWGEVFKFLCLRKKISACSKHVLCQLYREHLYDYEVYYNKLNQGVTRGCKRGLEGGDNGDHVFESSVFKRRRRSHGGGASSCRVDREEEHDQICEQCQSGLHGEVMLLCDRCNKGWHMYCLSPPLKRVPPGNWYCFECLNSDKDSFGFVPGKQFSLEAFRRIADRAKKKWFRTAPTSRMQLEKKFWEIVEGTVGEVEVMYGSDIDTSVYGSGFPRANNERLESVEADVWEEYCASPWNLNNLPKLKGSMLRAVHNGIAGVMVPWLYVGMLFSSFCWHFEDHCFYSMNYMHWGEPKCWYSVPGKEAGAFEKVMKSSLPDLFDAQPDLLFQLVTMLNPSVLQENGVPVYSVLQEPGNFVITFPRSYHAGFNFGLNCAEAVNFAPADWLPHGGFGAELYRLYRKAAVLSHEELLCVVAKVDSASNVSPFLKKELSRIYAKERSWRERLWRFGISKSSPMSSREHPDYVGTEEDPTCIICQQYLYLSAVVCHCRSSIFVCLEHWEHLCECTPSKRRLLYRHTLAELNDLVLMEDLSSLKEIPQHRSSKRQLLSSDEANSVSKKVNGVSVTLSQLAEDWLLSCCKIFQTPYSRGSFSKALKQAEQFLWAGSEMDPVRDVAKNIVDAQNWAEGIRDCLSNIESWSENCDSDAEKVSLEHVNNLLSFKHVPCNEPRIILLKDYAEKAMALYEEIDCALAKSSKRTELELLQSRACDLALHLSNVEKLNQKISSTEAWMSNLRKYISDESSTVIEVDVLHNLKSEILKLQVEVPEVEMLDNLIRQAESCQARCNEILNGPMNIKTVENLLQELGSCSINLFELKLLKQYYSDAISWTSCFNDLLINVHGREDQENVVHELECLLKEGKSLKIQVDEVPSVEIELRKACCRVKAWEARESKFSLDYLHHIVAEAAELQIAEEKLFVNISGVLECALCWEDKAKHVLVGKAQMSEFEDVMRASVDICAILPSLEAVEAAVSMARAWLQNSEPYLKSSCNAGSSCSSDLKIERLKELILQSDSLKTSLEEQAKLKVILQNCKEWEVNAQSLIEDSNRLFNFDNIGNATDDLIPEIQSLLARIVSANDAGFSLGFEFIEISELEEASSVLQWCCRALSLCSVVPQLEEVKHLVGLAEQLPRKWSSSPLCNSLVDGTKWLKKAAEVVSSSGKRSTLIDVQSILAEVQTIKLAFPLMISQLLNAMKNHELWLEQVHLYFRRMSEKRSWSQILKLKDLGDADAFSCPVLDMVVFEVDKVEKWKKRCNRIMRLPADDSNSLLIGLMKIRDALDRVLGVFDKSRCSEIPCLCMWCSNDFEDQKFLTCSICNDWYHLSCVEPIPTYAKDNRTLAYTCLYCQFIESGSVSWSRGSCMSVRGKHPDVKILFDLVSESKDFTVWIEESDILQEVVEKALQWQACLKGILDCTLTYVDKDLIVIKEKLTIALKAVEVSGLFDHQNYCYLDAALARNAWRIRVDNKLLGTSQKPSIQQIQRHLKEGLAIMIPPEDHYSKKLNELKHIGMRWIDNAKKVAGDSGSLELDEVFDLIMEGEQLPVQVEKELKLLKTRSMLYCICRKPYDQRAMIACDQCDEWYHFDCIKLSFTPKVYICPACAPQSEVHLEPLLDNQDELTDTKFGGPKTPSPHNQEPRGRRKTMQFILQRNESSVPFSDNKNLRSSGIDQLLWRNKKPFSRAARKRTDLSLFCNVQTTN